MRVARHVGGLGGSRGEGGEARGERQGCEGCEGCKARGEGTVCVGGVITVHTGGFNVKNIAHCSRCPNLALASCRGG